MIYPMVLLFFVVPVTSVAGKAILNSVLSQWFH